MCPERFLDEFLAVVRLLRKQGSARFISWRLRAMRRMVSHSLHCRYLLTQSRASRQHVTCPKAFYSLDRSQASRGYPLRGLP
eukprot:3781557-Pyramimonas_sp.AAC.1